MDNRVLKSLLLTGNPDLVFPLGYVSLLIDPSSFTSDQDCYRVIDIRPAYCGAQQLLEAPAGQVSI
jgi:hypothetical protein